MQTDGEVSTDLGKRHQNGPVDATDQVEGQNLTGQRAQNCKDSHQAFCCLFPMHRYVCDNILSHPLVFARWAAVDFP